MSVQPRVLTVTPNPAIDQTLEVAGFAAGRVNRVLSSRMDAGGKGINVATTLGELKVPVMVTGFLGAQNAAIFEDHFVAHGLQDQFLRVPGSTRTGIKVVDTETRETTDINFSGLQIKPAEAALLQKAVQKLAIPGSWNVLSGSLPVGLDADFYSGLIHAIHARGGHALLDTSGEPLRHALFARPEIVKPNLAELEELVGRQLGTTAEVLEATDELLTGSTRLVVLSMGAEGALFLNRQTALLAHPPRVPVVSTVGAGDAMVAGIVWSLLEGMDLTQTARWSTAFGAYAVTRCGAGIQMAAVENLVEQVRVSVLQRNLNTGRAIAEPIAAQGV